MKLAGPIIRGIKGISGKVKAKVAAGKAWVKGKVEAGKEWAKGKVEAGKQWVRGKVEAGKAAVTGKGTARTAPEDAARHQRIGQEAAGRLTSAKSLDLKDFEKRARAVERDLGPQVRPGATLKVKHGEPKSQSASGHLPFSVVIAPNTTIVPDEATLEHMGEIARELKAELNRIRERERSPHTPGSTYRATRGTYSEVM